MLLLHIEDLFKEQREQQQKASQAAQLIQELGQRASDLEQQVKTTHRREEHYNLFKEIGHCYSLLADLTIAGNTAIIFWQNAAQAFEEAKQYAQTDANKSSIDERIGHALITQALIAGNETRRWEIAKQHFKTLTSNCISSRYKAVESRLTHCTKAIRKSKKGEFLYKQKNIEAFSKNFSKALDNARKFLEETHQPISISSSAHTNPNTSGTPQQDHPAASLLQAAGIDPSHWNGYRVMEQNHLGEETTLSPAGHQRA